MFASDCLPPSAEDLAGLARAAELVDVVQVVALPDLHIKPQLETPSSTAVATRNTIVLGLSSPSPNCSMALALTSLHLDDLNDERLDRLFGALIHRLPLHRQSRVLSLPELADILLRGGAAAVERYNLDPAILRHMDQQGNAITSANVDVEAVLQVIPRMLQEVGSWHFALIGRGNHFLELQVVDELLNDEVASLWGLSPGQLVVMYHADSGYLGAFTGRLYAHRRKNSWRGRLHEWRLKFPFHLTTGQLGRLLHRINYHVLPRYLTPIPVDSEEGRRTLLALQAASNYAYANRLAILAALRDSLRVVWGQRCASPALLWDAPHNSIRQETIAGEELWVHRHNATRAVPPSDLPGESPFARTGQPVLLPGLERTSSYLCVAGNGAAHTLHSVDHGTGRSVMKMGRLLNGTRTTRLYTYQGGLTQSRPHLSDEGLEAVLAILKSNDIAWPVVRLRPLAVLKDQG
ncbi:MAG: RtcB family protein [Anaerolineae bacterium]|nr:RtcB family protein [Anaerolineae bacterium]